MDGYTQERGSKNKKKKEKIQKKYKGNNNKGRGTIMLFLKENAENEERLKHRGKEKMDRK